MKGVLTKINTIKGLWVNMNKKMRAICINFLKLNAMFMMLKLAVISIWGCAKYQIRSDRSVAENVNVGQSDFSTKGEVDCNQNDEVDR